MTVRTRLACYLSGPFLAGVLIAVATVAGHPVTGHAKTLVNVLALAPAVLMHTHARTARFGVVEALLLTLAGGVAAYGLMVLGLAAGAASTLALAIAIKAGALSAVADLSAVAGTYLMFRPRPT